MARDPAPVINPRDPILGPLKGFLDWVHRRLSVELPLLLRGSKEWDPPNTVDGAYATTTVAVPGAKKGDPAVAAHSEGIPEGTFLAATVAAEGVATVTLTNLSGTSANVQRGMLRVVVLRYAA